MNTAKIKRHLKLFLKHPLQVSIVPVLIATVSSTYILAIGIFYVGYKSGIQFQSKYAIDKIPVPINVRFSPSNNNSPIYNTEPNNSDDLLTPDETDEQFEKDMNDLLMDFNKDVYAYSTTSSDIQVLGMSENKESGVPVERRIYNDKYTKQVQPDVNVITPADNMGLFSFKNVVVPVLALGFAVLGINYLEHHHTRRKKLAVSHRKHSK